MPNPVPSVAEGMPDYPRNSHPIGFFRELLMRWNARRAKEPVTQNQDQESFMNQHVDRRALLASSAFAVAAAMPAAADSIAPTNEGEDAGLFSLLREYDVANAELVEARNDLEWLVAEWRHLWPLAPEEILGVANAHVHSTQNAERDMAGNYMMRDRASLTKRLSPKFRREGGQSCFEVYTAAELSDKLAGWEKFQPTGRTSRALSRSRAHRAKRVAELTEQTRLARQYETDTARVHAASGVANAKLRVDEKAMAANALASRLMIYPAMTLRGISAKASFFISFPGAKWTGRTNRGDVLSFGWTLAEDIKRAAEKGAVG